MMGSMTNSSYSDDDNNNTFDLSMQKIRDNSNSNDNNYGLDTTRALSHPINKPKPVRKVHFNNVREVHFNNVMIINEIPSHRALTSHERLSLWYTKVDYKFFQIEERKKNKRNRFAASIENNENENNNNNNNRNNKDKTHNTLSSSSNSRSSNNPNPNPNKLSKSCQQRRIHEIRCMVLIRAQYAYQNLNLQRFDEKNVSTTTTTSSSSSNSNSSNNNHNNIIVDGYARDSYYFQQQQRRLAEFYRQHSWPCLQAARERALENEIWNINRKLQEHFQYYQKQMVSHTQAASSCFQHWF